MRNIILIAALTLLTACSRTPERPTEFIVFFPAGSAEVPPEARVVLDSAVVAIRATHPAAVAIASGVVTGDNLRLAEPRYNAVANALIARGISAEVIARSSLPDAKFNVGTTGFQRVEIMLLANR